MRKIAVAVALGAMAVPATAVAAPSAADKREANNECLAIKRAAVKPSNFKQVVAREARKTTQRAFVACVHARAKKAESERKASRSEAFAACASLKPSSSDAPRGRPSDSEQRNAYGKCVSAEARKRNAERDEEQRDESLNPARFCRGEETRLGATAFRQAYGGERNAFGKCVSQRAQSQNDDEQQPTS